MIQKRVIVALIALLLLCTTASADEEYIKDCGLLQKEGNSCFSIRTDNFGKYLINEVGYLFLDGDYIYVEGTVSVDGCNPDCSQWDGCLVVDSIWFCPEYLYVKDCGFFTWEGTCSYFDSDNYGTYMVGLSAGQYKSGDYIYIEGEVYTGLPHWCNQWNGFLYADSSSYCLESFHIEDCGIIYQGVETGCILIDTYEHGDYLITNYSGHFITGDTIYVEGEVDPACDSYCMQGDGCLTYSIAYPCEFTEPFAKHGKLVIAGDAHCTCLLIDDGWTYHPHGSTTTFETYELHGSIAPFEINDDVMVFGQYQFTPSICMVGPIVGIDSIFAYVPTETPSGQEPLPHEFKLLGNYPNPFNASTNISYSIPERAEVRIIVYDILGREVKVLFDQAQPVGEHFIHWDGTDKSGHVVASGVYFYSMQAGEYSANRKMVLMK